MEEEFFSSSESETENPQFEEIIYKKERPKKKPDRKGMTKTQLEARMKNLEKARQARLANLQKKKKTIEVDIYSSDDGDSETDSEMVLTKRKAKKPKKESKTDDRLDRMEKMMKEMYKSKKAKKSKIEINLPPQQGGRTAPKADPVMEDIRRRILI